MYDMASFYSSELRLIAKSEGTTAEERGEIKAELALRRRDPGREPEMPDEVPSDQEPPGPEAFGPEAFGPEA